MPSGAGRLRGTAVRLAAPARRQFFASGKTLAIERGAGLQQVRSCSRACAQAQARPLGSPSALGVPLF